MSDVSAGVTLPPDYPAHWVHDVVLADGGLVHVRPIHPGDGPALLRFHSRLSPHSIYLRYFSAHPRLSEKEVERLTTVDYVHRLAFVATVGDEIVAVARYEGQPGSPSAEVAFLVEDAQHGRGIGTLLLEALAVAARANGIEEFTAVTLWDNKRMLGVFQEVGFEVSHRAAEGEVEVRFPVGVTPSLAKAVARREHQAEALSLKRFLTPRSIAVVGAGRERGGVGHELFRNLLAGEFNGPVYPVHHRATHVGGVRAYPTVTDIPDEVDLAVICVPASATMEVVRQCGEKGVRGLVMITAGFAEMSGAAVEAEQELLRLVRRYGMRMIGPNCMGVANMAPGVSMHATFAPVSPAAGSLGFASQSGALGIAVLERAASLGLGISAFVSMGNKADVSSNDLLQYWEDDLGTDVILLYVESFGNPGKFHRIARRISRRKPIVAVKSGRSRSGTRAASSHTAAMASPDLAVDALFRQTGVIRVATLQELFDMAQVLDHQPLPAGRRVVIVGNSGGPGILAADACESAGLEVPELSEKTQVALRALLPPAAAVRNPVDMLAAAGRSEYEQVIRVLLDDPDVDALIVVFTPALSTSIDDVAAALATVSEGATKPIVANFLGVEGVPEGLRNAGTRPVPSFPFPEAAALALGRTAQYAEWRASPEGTVPHLDGVDVRAARGLVDPVLDEHPEGMWLDGVTAGEVLASFGIPVVAARKVESAAEAAEAAAALGFPVVLKAAAGSIVHKTDVGAVRLNLTSAAAVEAAYQQMADALGEAMGGGLVQQMADPGVELIVGVVRDASFGPLVMFGAGGTSAELLRDRVLAVTPMTDRDAEWMVGALRSAPLLTGFRGSKPVDVAGLQDLLLRVAHLAEQVPEIQEMDLNPVIATPAGVVAVDVKLRIASHRRHPEHELRRLR
jgi:acetyl coenzyme A synthetase (ADP forming)-like protein